MKQLGFTSILVGTFVLAVGCGDKQTNTSSIDSEVLDSAEASIGAVGSVVDDHVLQSGYARLDRASRYHLIADWIQAATLPRAQASNCQRAASQACAGGVKSIVYSACDLSDWGHQINDGDGNALTPSVQLTYSTADCRLSSPGDFVDRQYDFVIAGPRGGSLRISSQPLAGSQSGVEGGGRLTFKSAGQWGVEIFGRNSTLTGPGGRNLFNHSLETSQEILISGGLARGARVIESGQIKTYHNLTASQVTHTLEQLTYSGSCCHPVSGKITSVATGRFNGTFVTVFNGCGTAVVSNEAGASKTVTLNYCE
jgi:hypothetical protein